MANLIKIKVTGDSAQTYVIDSTSIRIVQTVEAALDGFNQWYFCKIYYKNAEVDQIKFYAPDGLLLEKRINEAILAQPGGGSVTVDTSGILFEGDPVDEFLISDISTSGYFNENVSITLPLYTDQGLKITYTWGTNPTEVAYKIVNNLVILNFASKYGVAQTVNLNYSYNGVGVAKEFDINASLSANPSLPAPTPFVYKIIPNNTDHALPLMFKDMLEYVYGVDTSVELIYDFTIDWGDGSPVEQISTADVSTYIVHTYPDNVSEYTITMTGVYEGWSVGAYYDYDDQYYDTAYDIMDVISWGDLKILGAGQLAELYGDGETPFTVQNLPELKLGYTKWVYSESNNENYIKSLDYLFSSTEWPALYNYDFSQWDISGVKSLNGTFSSVTQFDNDSIAKWNTSSVTDISYMFDSTSFNQDLSSWEVGNVTNMEGLFSLNEVFNQPIGDWNWDTSKVTNMSYMFQSAISFNQPVQGLNISSVTNMQSMFDSAESFDQHVNSWDISKVTDISWMFYGTLAFNKPLDKWNTSNVTYMNGMFSNAELFNQDLSNWDTSKVIDMTAMFNNAYAFNQDISSWNTSNVTSMSYMFKNNTVFNQPIGSWDVSNVTDMGDMFNNAQAFNQDITNWNVGNVTNMRRLFWSSNVFNQDISSWDVSSVTNMQEMFELTTVFNQDISSWNTSNVTNMQEMFRDATAFNQDLSGWDVANVVFYANFATGATAWVLPKPTF